MPGLLRENQKPVTLANQAIIAYMSLVLSRPSHALFHLFSQLGHLQP